MRIGLFGINMHDLAGPGALAAVARHAEAAGIESLWAGEHQVFPTAPLARQLQSPTDPILDPLLALTCAAAVTERLVLATGILLLPLRHPVTLAKELATLDVLSAGRLVVGVGIGYLDVELAALGVRVDVAVIPQPCVQGIPHRAPWCGSTRSAFLPLHEGCRAAG